MTESAALRQVRRLLYACENRAALSRCEELGRESLPLEERAHLELLRAQALVELHEMQAAEEVLKNLCADQHRHSENFLYVRAKVAYLRNDQEQAERLFNLLMEKSESVRDYFRAALGLANVWQTARRHTLVASIVSELGELVPLVAWEDQISFRLLVARHDYLGEQRRPEARKELFAVIRSAREEGAPYFIVRALYYLAELEQAAGARDAMRAHLETLRCWLSPEETGHMNYIVNERFKEENFTVALPLEFDWENRRVQVSGAWIALHDKPLIFGFLQFLYQAGRFVAKKEIALFLWPREEYKPRVHDPRIFDIARRVRAMIEPYDDQPLCLLSGRFGYKLAVGEEAVQSHNEAAATA